MKVVINPAYSFLSDFINNLPDCFESDGDVIYEGRNVLKKFYIRSEHLVVKRFRVPHLINRVAYSFFRESKALRSYQFALRLLGMNVNTPTPIAYIEEYKNGLIYYSYYISLESEFDIFRSLYDLPLDQKQDILKSFAYFTSELHKKGIYHKDYTQGNILFKRGSEDIEFTIIDINRMAFNFVNKEKGFKNFQALWEKEDSLIYIAEWYSFYMGYDKQESIDRILYYNRLFNIKKESILKYLCCSFPKFWQS